MNHVSSWIFEDLKHNQLISSLFEKRPKVTSGIVDG
uniref:Transposase n=1 Tax=Heterorhabditis bacteriophora TaxID=37862 RepID=A0A1I7WKG3_HETBA